MTDAKIVPLQEPTIRRGNHGEAFSQDVKDAAFSLYVVVCNHDCAAVERVLRDRMPGEAIPTPQTIRNWARAENWSGQSDDVWRSGGKRTIYELRRGALGIAILSLQTNRDAQTGGLDHLEPWQGALRLKASELGMRLVERGVIALQAFDPPQDDQDTSDLSLQEREAEASARIVQDRKRAIGGRTPMRNTATR